jgi:hypothetical protein
MSLENKDIAELEQLASHLREQIARSPNHSRMERVELEDIQDWLTAAQKRS